MINLKKFSAVLTVVDILYIYFMRLPCMKYLSVVNYGQYKIAKLISRGKQHSQVDRTVLGAGLPSIVCYSQMDPADTHIQVACYSRTLCVILPALLGNQQRCP